MTKTKLEVINLSHPNSIKTVVGALVTLKSTQRMKVKLRKMESLSLNLISGILIAFFTIAGCSDMPYTGAMMTTDNVDVDQYMVSPNEELVCLQNGPDSECLTLIPKNRERADSINGPIIHIHPEKLVYIAYHEGKEIVRAEKVMDTTEIVETLTETKEEPAPQTDAPSSEIVVHDADNTPQPDPPPPPQVPDPPPPPQVPDPPPPPQTDAQSGGSVVDDPDDNNNGGNTPPPPPQTDDQSGGTAGDESDNNNNGGNTPRTPPPPPPPPPQTDDQSVHLPPFFREYRL